MSFSSNIEDQDLVEFDLSSWTHLILTSLCYAFGLVILSKVVPCPICSCFMLFPEPHLGPQCCLYNLLEGQPETSWPLGGKCCIISTPSRDSGLLLSCLLQCVEQQHLSVNPLGWATGTLYLLEVHLLASAQGQLGFQGQCLPLWELALQAIWAQTLTTLLLKLQTYPHLYLHSTLTGYLACCLLSICF